MLFPSREKKNGLGVSRHRNASIPARQSQAPPTLCCLWPSTLDTMPGYDDRASILQGAGDMIFKLVCERATREQWAEWLRAPLEHAAGTANHDLVKKLLEAGANGSAGWRGCDGKTLLHAGAEGGDAQVIPALIRAGAGADMKAKALGTGRTPLHVAVVGGKEAAAKALMLAGADANVLDHRRDAPLHLAIKGGHVRLVEGLLLLGAGHAVQGSDGAYPIHLAVERGQDEVVQALVQKGANMDCLKNGCSSPLRLAVMHDRVPTLNVLLAGGADVNLKNIYGFTVLHTAARLSKAWAIPALVEAGADIETRCSWGETPLHRSAFAGACGTMLVLLQLGADVSAKSENTGMTPLHFACVMGKTDAVDLLLRWGADETIVDNDGKSPSQRLPDIAQAGRVVLERLSKLLGHAPRDRAWRRRGFVVMCRAHPERLRLVVEISDTAPSAVGQPQERPSRRARRGQVNVEIGGAHGGGGRGAGSTSRRAGSGGGGEGSGGGFDGVAAWLVGLQDEQLFHSIVGFL